MPISKAQTASSPSTRTRVTRILRSEELGDALALLAALILVASTGLRVDQAEIVPGAAPDAPLLGAASRARRAFAPRTGRIETDAVADRPALGARRRLWKPGPPGEADGERCCHEQEPQNSITRSATGRQSAAAARPAVEIEAAKRISGVRYQQFVSLVPQQLAAGARLVDDVVKEKVADPDELAAAAAAPSGGRP